MRISRDPNHDALVKIRLAGRQRSVLGTRYFLPDEEPQRVAEIIAAAVSQAQ